MASPSYDIITIGGGLGGAALAKVMAERGARVLVLESETRFRDRVRGEVMVSWGVAEAKELGIYENMMAAGGKKSNGLTWRWVVTSLSAVICEPPPFRVHHGCTFITRICKRLYSRLPQMPVRWFVEEPGSEECIWMISPKSSLR